HGLADPPDPAALVEIGVAGCAAVHSARVVGLNRHAEMLVMDVGRYGCFGVVVADLELERAGLAAGAVEQLARAERFDALAERHAAFLRSGSNAYLSGGIVSSMPRETWCLNTASRYWLICPTFIRLVTCISV